MNPMTNVKNVKKLSELELKRSLKTSWHDQYKDSAWIFVGGLPYDLTEGDIICVFSQYGEVVNLNLVRDKATGKSKGFCFLCYEDQRSTALGVDNLNGIKILGRTIRVDHVSDYKPPKISDKMDDETKKLNAEGCASVAAPCHDVKDLKIVKKEKEDIEKPKKKKSKRKSKKKESSCSEDSNNSSDSESDDSKAGSAYHHTKKNKNSRKKEKKKSKKKKSKIAEVTSDSSTDNETIRDSREKRRKLVEKIKFLEAALSNSRKAAKRTDFSEEIDSKFRSEDADKRAFGEHYNDGIKRNVQKENNKREKTFHHNTEMSHNKNDDYISRRQMNDHDNIKKRNASVSSTRDKSKDTLWSVERGQDRDSDWERTKEKDKYARDRTYENRRFYERNYKHHRK